jgi:hypothetical protein
MPDILISARVPENSVSDAVAALKPFATSEIEVFAQFETPEYIEVSCKEKIVDEVLAQEIASTIAPTPKQTMRREVLESVLWHWDSLLDTKGEGDPAMRVALGALSKALRPFAPYMASPIELICVREREFLPTGEYRATVYRPTDLGVCVRDILIEKGAIK